MYKRQGWWGDIKMRFADDEVGWWGDTKMRFVDDEVGWWGDIKMRFVDDEVGWWRGDIKILSRFGGMMTKRY